jgi:hypothetical protein
MFLVVVFVPGRLPCKFHVGYHGDGALVLFRAGYCGRMIGHNSREVLFLFLLLFLFRAGCHKGIIGHNTRKLWFLYFVLFLFLVNVVVPSRLQAIALRRSYSDDCSCSYYCSCSYFLSQE